MKLVAMLKGRSNTISDHFKSRFLFFFAEHQYFLGFKKRRVRTQRAKDHQLLCRNLEQHIWNRVVVHKLGESIPLQF
jgi:hypothetical protein